MSSKTKEKILETALHLFNDQGIDKITVRHIAQAMGISHGNLCYHYPNTDDIIFQLYQNLKNEMSVAIQKVSIEEINLSLLYTLSKTTLVYFDKFRFFFLNYVEIMRRNPNIRLDYLELAQQRRQQLLFLCQQLIKNGILKPEVAIGHYEKIVDLMFIIGDFWLSSAEVLYQGHPDNKIQYYLDMRMGMLLACLSEKGLEEYYKLGNSKIQAI